MTWTYDAETTEYIDSAGEVYGDDDKFFWLWAFLDNISNEMIDVSERYANRAITLSEWDTAMQDLIYDAFIAVYILGAGGKQQMTQDDYAELDKMIVEQYGYLDKFVGVAPDMTKAGIVNRASMYAQAAQAAFWAASTKSKQKAGFTQEMVVLGQAEHCPTCVGWNSEGWQAIGYFPPLGAGYSECMTHCKCNKEYR